MKRAALLLFVLGFGLLPLWAAAAAVYYGGRGLSAASDYWNTAPWLIILAVPVSAVTLAITGVTVAVHRSTAGAPARKWRFSIPTFFALVGAIAAVVGAWWNYRQELQDEWQLAVEFVRSDRAVTEMVGDEPRAQLAWTRRENSSPTAYAVAVSGTTTVYAVVEVSRTWLGNPEFTLACVTREEIASTSSADPCPP